MVAQVQVIKAFLLSILLPETHPQIEKAYEAFLENPNKIVAGSLNDTFMYGEDRHTSEEEKASMVGLLTGIMVGIHAGTDEGRKFLEDFIKQNSHDAPEVQGENVIDFKAARAARSKK